MNAPTPTAGANAFVFATPVQARFVRIFADVLTSFDDARTASVERDTVYAMQVAELSVLP